MTNPLIFTAEYISGKEALLIRVDLTAYLIDYYIHRKDVLEAATAEQDEKLKELIACFAIHLAAHSASQSHAWTLHMIASPPFSLFVTGSIEHQDTNTARGYLVGNVLTDSVRHTDVNSLHAQFSDREGKLFRSYVQAESSNISDIVEHFYAQSEQQPLRIHISKTSDTAIGLAALPDFDTAWFESIDLESLVAQHTVPRKLMRSGRMTFTCDCSPEKLMPFFRSLPEDQMQELYGDDQELMINCPRCGKSFAVSRSSFQS